MLRNIFIALSLSTLSCLAFGPSPAPGGGGTNIYYYTNIFPASASVNITNVPTGGSATANVIGTSNLVFNFGIPVGATGATGGSTLPAGVVTNNGNATNLTGVDAIGRVVYSYQITIITNLSPNTNVYYFQGAGSAGYTTPFYWNGVIGGYTNATKVFGSVNDTGWYYESGNAPLSSLAGNDDYSPTGVRPLPGSSAPTNWISLNGALWEADLYGVGTATGYFATNVTYITNQVTVFTNANFINPVGSYIYASPNGNDSTAIRGEPSRPFKTIDAIQTIIHSSDTVVCSAGSIDNSNATITASGLKICGAGTSATFLNLGSFQDNDNISSLTLSNCYFGGCTNVVLNNVNITGLNDCLAPGTGRWNIQVFNSLLTTAYDAWADTTSDTNSFCTMYNCVMLGADKYSSSGTAFCPEIVTLGAGRLKMVAGAIINTASTGGANPCCVNANTANAYAEFYNVYFQAPNIAGATNWVIYNPSGATMKLYNCVLNTNLIYDPSNKVTIINGYLGGNFSGTFTGNGSGLTFNQATGSNVIAGVALTNGAITTSSLTVSSNLPPANPGEGNAALWNSNNVSMFSIKTLGGVKTTNFLFGL
jgi:hypothetical protein